LYPRYTYYPRWQEAPPWVPHLAQVFAASESAIDTSKNANKSDVALEVLRPGLITIGFEVETGKTKAGKLFRPVFFGENERPERQYQIDAYHPGERIALEVEAGRSVLGNAIYRDIVQISLLVDVDYAAVAVPTEYRYQTQGRPQTNEPYRECRTILEAVYGGRRLVLPFKGFMLIGY
jgi:hypothetical protein